jgi:hypothetical protein
LTNPQIEELNELLNELLEICQQIAPTGTPDRLENAARSLLSYNNQASPKDFYSCIYSESLLNDLRKQKHQYWIQIRNKWIDFSPVGNWRDWAMTLEASDIGSFSLQECQMLVPFLSILLQEKNIEQEILSPEAMTALRVIFKR